MAKFEDIQYTSGNFPEKLIDTEKESLDLDKVKELIEQAKKEVLEETKKDTKMQIDEQIQTDKASLMTIFGVFASILSFLTIEFQFLKSLSTVMEILGFSMILCSLLLSFNVVLDNLIKSRIDKDEPRIDKYFIIIICLLFFGGVIFLLYNPAKIKI